MSNINVTFRKEVVIDLNAYYPNFPGSLRREIDDALFKLLGGTPAKPKEARKPRQKIVGKICVADSEPPEVGSKGRIVFDEIKNEYGKRQVDAEALRQFIKSVGVKKGFANPSAFLGNLVKGGYLEQVK